MYVRIKCGWYYRIYSLLPCSDEQLELKNSNRVQCDNMNPPLKTAVCVSYGYLFSSGFLAPIQDYVPLTQRYKKTWSRRESHAPIASGNGESFMRNCLYSWDSPSPTRQNPDQIADNSQSLMAMGVNPS